MYASLCCVCVTVSAIYRRMHSKQEFRAEVIKKVVGTIVLTRYLHYEQSLQC